MNSDELMDRLDDQRGPCKHDWCEELHCYDTHCEDDEHIWKIVVSCGEWEGDGIDAVQYDAVWYECKCGATKEYKEEKK